MCIAICFQLQYCLIVLYTEISFHYITLAVRTALCFKLRQFAIVYGDEHVNYVVKKLMLKNRKKSKNLIHANSNISSQNRKITRKILAKYGA